MILEYLVFFPYSKLKERHITDGLFSQDTDVVAFPDWPWHFRKSVVYQPINFPIFQCTLQNPIHVHFLKSSISTLFSSLTKFLTAI